MPDLLATFLGVAAFIVTWAAFEIVKQNIFARNPASVDTARDRPRKIIRPFDPEIDTLLSSVIRDVDDAAARSLKEVNGSTPFSSVQQCYDALNDGLKTVGNGGEILAWCGEKLWDELLPYYEAQVELAELKNVRIRRVFHEPKDGILPEAERQIIEKHRYHDGMDLRVITQSQNSLLEANDLDPSIGFVIFDDKLAIVHWGLKRNESDDFGLQITNPHLVSAFRKKFNDLWRNGDATWDLKHGVSDIVRLQKYLVLDHFRSQQAREAFLNLFVVITRFIKTGFENGEFILRDSEFFMDFFKEFLTSISGKDILAVTHASPHFVWETSLLPGSIEERTKEIIENGTNISRVFILESNLKENDHGQRILKTQKSIGVDVSYTLDNNPSDNLPFLVASDGSIGWEVIKLNENGSIAEVKMSVKQELTRSLIKRFNTIAANSKPY